MKSKVEDWMRQYIVSSGFARKYPYYASVLARLVPVESAYVAAMAVEAQPTRVYLHINVPFFIANLRYLWGVLLHEIHHVVLGHLTNPRLRAVDDWTAMELAMEVSANEYIREPLPGDPPVWRHYRHLGLGAGQSTMERYRLLAASRAAGVHVPLPVLTDTHVSRGVGHNPALEWSAHRRLTRLLRDAIEEVTQTLGERQGGLLAGCTPGNLLEQFVEPDVAPPPCVIDWKQALRMFVSRYSHREWRCAYDRPNRRFPGLIGVVPGRIRRPDSKQKPQLLVAVDTSGSMGVEELAEVARELKALRDLARFTVVECDVSIQRVYPFEGQVDSFAGRGGTDLRPPFEATFLREQGALNGLVYFTDGLGPYPDEAPPFPTLWVLTKTGLPFACPWGKQARMQAEDRWVNPTYEIITAAMSR
jgi:predicted metal-dependent peptidase